MDIRLAIRRVGSVQTTSTAQPDFEGFWERTKAEGLAQPFNPELVPIDYPVKRVQVFSATFDGYAGGSDHPPRAGGWFFIPEDPAPRPALVIYHGYHGYRDRISTHLPWALLGFVVLAMDVRGRGEAPDWTEYEGGHGLGWMTRGIMNKEEYLYRFAYMDSVARCRICRRASGGRSQSDRCARRFTGRRVESRCRCAQ